MVETGEGELESATVVGLGLGKIERWLAGERFDLGPRLQND